MKQLQGVIRSLSGENTVTVSVSRQWRHPLYLKSVKRTKNYACHYTDLQLAVGDQVVIQQSKPMSKTKHFVVINTVDASESK
jgi:small subunit ribosomal protein S17